MSGLSIKSCLKLRYATPVAGWIGCALLLQFMMSGMQEKGVFRSAPIGEAQSLAMRKAPERTLVTLQVASRGERSEPEVVEARSEADGGPELAERRRPEAPL